ncbi:MAG: hypothetical protein ACRC5C_15200 [Bacilli bacterium]
MNIINNPELSLVYATLEERMKRIEIELTNTANEVVSFEVIQQRKELDECIASIRLLEQHLHVLVQSVERIQNQVNQLAPKTYEPQD